MLVGNYVIAYKYYQKNFFYNIIYMLKLETLVK